MDAAIAQPATKLRRRWYQFSLRTMMIAVTLMCVGLAWLAKEMKIVRDRAAALARIEGGLGFRYMGDCRSYETPWSSECFEINPDHVDVRTAPFKIDVVEALILSGNKKLGSPSIRKLLGDCDIFEIECPPAASDLDCKKFHDLFPEAEIRRLGGEMQRYDIK